MHRTFLRNRVFRSGSGNNLKSKIQNPKWAGLLAILVLLVGCVGMAEAQQAAKISRIGFLSVNSAQSMAARVEAFRQGLRELGYIDGKNIVVEWRYADGKLDRVPELAAELVRLKVDIIVTGGAQTTRAAKEATTTIPIVMAREQDPIGTGFIASLARPGGNITGLAAIGPQLAGKRLELLKEIIPKLSRVAVFGNATNPGNAEELRETEDAARALGLKLQYLEVQSPDDIEGAFQAATKGRSGALITLGNPVIFRHRKRVAELAAKSRLPATYAQTQFADVGGLLVYGPQDEDMYRRSARYVDKILKGAKPADLPVEQPTKFELIVNLKTAKQIGLTIPPNVLVRADKVIK